MGLFSRGTGGSENANVNAANQGRSSSRRAQAVNQAQAGQRAGRGSRSISGQPATTRSKPSRTF